MRESAAQAAAAVTDGISQTTRTLVEQVEKEVVEDEEARNGALQLGGVAVKEAVKEKEKDEDEDEEEEEMEEAAEADPDDEEDEGDEEDEDEDEDEEDEDEEDV